MANASASSRSQNRASPGIIGVLAFCVIAHLTVERAWPSRPLCVLEDSQLQSVVALRRANFAVESVGLAAMPD